jgi:peptidoglycan-associated lipoprotein
MNRKLNLILLLGIALFVSACASNKKEEAVVETTEEPAAPTVDNNAFGTGMTVAELEAIGIMGNTLNYKTVYFEYNSSAIDRRSEVIAAAHAREIGRTGVAQVTLEGHADERGTRDYNLALGERRALAVSSLMSNSGAGSANIRSISYGEERPVDTAHTEEAWAKNRRVEIGY